MVIVNETVPVALKRLNYEQKVNVFFTLDVRGTALYAR